MNIYNTILIVIFSAITHSKIQTCGKVYNIPSNCQDPTFVIFSPKGDLLATTSTRLQGDGAVTLLSVRDGKLSNAKSYILPSGTKPHGLAFSTDGFLLATANPDANSVTLFTVTAENTLINGKSYTLNSGSTFPQAVAFSPDGTLLATANSHSDNVTLFIVSAGILIDQTSYVLPSGSSSPKAVTFSPDGTLLATANSHSNSMTLFSVSEGSLDTGISYSISSSSKSPRSLAFSPDGMLLAVANYDSDDVTVFDIAGTRATGKKTYSLPSHSETPQSIAFSPDGSFLAIGKGSTYNLNFMAIFKVHDGELHDGTTYRLPPYVYPLSVAFSPNGSYLATGSISLEVGDNWISSRAIALLDTHDWCPEGDNSICPSYCIAGIISGASVFCAGFAIAALGLFRCRSTSSEQKPLLTA